MTRIQWLRRAVPSLRSMIRTHAPLGRRVRLKLGFAGTGPLRKECLGVTECDNGHADIEIDRKIRTGQMALLVLLHELVHAAQPRFDHEHSPQFRRLAKKVGFRSPFKMIYASEDLQSRMRQIVRRLGPYPKE